MSYKFNLPDWYVEPKELIIFDTCDECGREIYANKEYYDFDGIIICENCLYDYARRFKKEAMVDQMPYEDENN